MLPVDDDVDLLPDELNDDEDEEDEDDEPDDLDAELLLVEVEDVDVEPLFAAVEDEVPLADLELNVPALALVFGVCTLEPATGLFWNVPEAYVRG